ncbi:glycosyl transferase [Paenibacillus glycanilyticus]|uniref:Glycosyl transferase n=1 Tax=Paenibacillus glycanilyticus TaxID=126569 RepID=A0ABQ6NUU9_9BACL|nr:glycosyltransferase family 4 protein [Paenibacillus glycanilyticus]GMK48353.1 glycosyl transferase [Paenibacillus glycanilyticus]
MIKTVLFVNQTGRFGGAERVLFDLLSRMDQKRIKPILVCPVGEMQREAVKLNIAWIEVKEFQAIDTTRKQFKVNDAIRTLKLAQKLNKVIKQTKPSLIYTNSVKSHLLINLTKRKLPTIVRLHDFPGSFKGISKIMLKHSLSNSHYISCVSKSVENDVKGLLMRDSNSLGSQYNGYEIKTNNYVKQHYSKRIVIAGWLLDWKGYDIFVEAMEQIAELIPDWEFIIAGEAAKDVHGSIEYAQQLEFRVKNSRYANRFFMYGGYSSLQEVACCAEHCIFVHASIKPDPLPTVILEASGMELPIVCSNLGGSIEIIENKVGGYVVPPTATMIAEHVLKLVSDAEQRLKVAANARTNCLSFFSMKNYVNNMTELILQQAE